MQLKLEHEYFKSYLVRLPNYETKKCNENCNFSQTSEHLLLNCHYFTTERSIMINQMKSQTTTLKTLFGTKKGIENLGKFLIDTEIVTRKWGDSKENDEDEWKNHLEKMRHSDDQASFWTLKRFDQSNQFGRTSEKEYEEPKVRFIKLLNSVIIFRLNTLND
jgi:hypothetical protein